MNNKKRKEIYSWIKSILFAFIIVLVCRQFLFSPVVVKGESMLPTLENHNRLIINKIGKIDRFDLIVFDAPDVKKGTKAEYIKRVIGLPGDRLVMKDDVLYINGKAYKEPYVKRGNGKTTKDFTLEEIAGKTIIPDGYYFVMGDNRLKSNDSRRFGLISKDSIIGKVTLRFYPLEDAGLPY